jgi:hypothetical protein
MAIGPERSRSMYWTEVSIGTLVLCSIRDLTTYRNKFSRRLVHQMIGDHAVHDPREAVPDAFAQTVTQVDEVSRSLLTCESGSHLQGLPTWRPRRIERMPARVLECAKSSF